MSEEYNWLDQIIQEQAAHYSITADQHKALMEQAAEYQEFLEQEVF